MAGFEGLFLSPLQPPAYSGVGGLSRGNRPVPIPAELLENSRLFLTFAAGTSRPLINVNKYLGAMVNGADVKRAIIHVKHQQAQDSLQRIPGA
jgi:hypothetical protein